MKTLSILSFAMLVQLPALAHAQHADYAGQQTREIKALSPQEVKQYLAGSGMGFARAAELNRYPGPMHVLEHAERLALTPAQRAATEQLMATHKTEARALGAKLVEAERALDLLFATVAANEAALADQVRRVSALQGDYRLSHLETHRHMRALLTEEQINRYLQLRGYVSAHLPTGAHPH